MGQSWWNSLRHFEQLSGLISTMKIIFSMICLARFAKGMVRLFMRRKKRMMAIWPIPEDGSSHFKSGFFQMEGKWSNRLSIMGMGVNTSPNSDFSLDFAGKWFSRKE